MTTVKGRLGVLGGTFDPIHVGHLAAIEAAIACARLGRVILIPTSQPPHRPSAIAPADDRLAMCRLAAAGNERLTCTDLELLRPGPSYTVDTLAELHRLHPEAELFLILGWDAAGQFRTWHRPDQVRALATIVVVGRPGIGSPRAADLEAAGLDGSNVVLCLDHTPDVSASEIRRRVARGESIHGKVPPAVADYIAAHGLYTG